MVIAGFLNHQRYVKRCFSGGFCPAVFSAKSLPSHQKRGFPLFTKNEGEQPGLTLPETNSLHLKMGSPWKKEIPNLETIIFWGELLVFRECNLLKEHMCLIPLPNFRWDNSSVVLFLFLIVQVSKKTNL